MELFRVRVQFGDRTANRIIYIGATQVSGRQGESNWQQERQGQEGRRKPQAKALGWKRELGPTGKALPPDGTFWFLPPQSSCVIGDSEFLGIFQVLIFKKCIPKNYLKNLECLVYY